MTFWTTTLAMIFGTSVLKISHWLGMHSVWRTRWEQRCYGWTWWSIFAPTWLKRITHKEH